MKHHHPSDWSEKIREATSDGHVYDCIVGPMIDLDDDAVAFRCERCGRLHFFALLMRGRMKSSAYWQTNGSLVVDGVALCPIRSGHSVAAERKPDREAMLRHVAGRLPELNVAAFGPNIKRRPRGAC